MVWYSVPFGKVWGQIHGFDKLPKEKQKELASKMGPWYGLQLLVTVLTSVVLAMAIAALPETSPFVLSFLIWIGFVVPTQVSDVIFGGTEGRWIFTKIAILAFGSLACLWAAAFAIPFFI